MIQPADGVDVVKMLEDEIQIGQLVCSAQVVDASAHHEGVARQATPTLNHVSCGGVCGGEAVFDQAFRNPGTAHLVFFPKFAAAAGADQNDIRRVFRKVVDRRVVI